MKSTFQVLLALALVLAPLKSTLAQEELTDSELQLLADSAANETSDKLTLRLSDAVAMGIENNLDLQVQRFDPLIAFEDRESSWGSFDPVSSIDYSFRRTINPVSGNTLQGPGRTKNKEHDTTVGLASLLPYLGATVGIDFDTTRTSDVNPLSTQRPIWQTGVSLNGSVPLLKGLIWNQPWTRVKTTDAAYRGSSETFRARLMDVVQTIETAYWDLVAKGEGVRIGRKSLETASSLLDQTQTQYDVGVKSKVEVVESEAGVAAREFDLIIALNLYRKAQDDLIDAVLGTQLTAGTAIEVEPADRPDDYIHYEVDVVEAAERALASRPELTEATANIEQSEFNLKFAKNQRLPQLDVLGSYGVVGRAGRSRTTTGMFASTGADTGDFDNTFNDWGTKQGGTNVTAGAMFSIPIGNIAGRHNVSKGELELRKAHTRLIRLRQDIILQVRDGARNLKSAEEGIQAAERRRLAAEEQLRAENVRLEYGESTPFKVLEKEEDLVSAENAKVGALFTYRKSAVDLDRAQGTILKSRNIVVDEAASLR